MNTILRLPIIALICAACDRPSPSVRALCQTYLEARGWSHFEPVSPDVKDAPRVGFSATPPINSGYDTSVRCDMANGQVSAAKTLSGVLAT